MRDPSLQEEIIHLLKEMKREYEYMAGDYDFVAAIRRWALQLTEEKRRLLLESLFELFISDDPLGSYFCDVVVILHETDFAPRLVALLPSPDDAKPKHKEIVRTLMRLEYKQGIPVYLDYIQKLLLHNDFSAFTLLCHLYLVDPELALKESAMHIARVLDTVESMLQVNSYIPCFLHIYCKQTFLDIIRLVRFTMLHSIQSGRQLAQLILQCLSKEYEREKFTEDELIHLEQELKVLSGSR